MLAGAAPLHAGGAASGQRSLASFRGPQQLGQRSGSAPQRPGSKRSRAPAALRCDTPAPAPHLLSRASGVLRHGAAHVRRRPTAARASAACPPGIPTLTSAAGFHARFHLGDHLGKGSFATVHRATSRHDFQEFAVKVVAKPPGPGKALDRVLDRVTKEVHAWSAVQHCEHVARLEGVYEDEAAVYIVQELCLGGDVKALLEARGTLSERETAYLVKAMLSVVARCHSLGYSYGDIKPANLLLKHHYSSMEELARSVEGGTLEVKVVDFGCSQQATQYGGLQDRTGTPMYTAPEVFQQRPSLSSDVWGVGVLMYQALTSQLPFWDADMETVRKKPLHDVVAGIQYNDMGLGWRYASRHLSAEALDLLSQLLQRNKAERITAVAALAHPWLQKHCCSPTGALANVEQCGNEQAFAADAAAPLWGRANNVLAVSTSLVGVAQPAQFA